MATVLITAAVAWRLADGLPSLLRITLISTVPLLGLRAAGWIMSCFDRPRDALKNTDDMRVVVSVPVYNEDPGLLDRCLFALVNQTRPPQRVDVVNDGSTVDYTTLRAFWSGWHGQTLVTWTAQPNAGKRRAHCRTFSDEMTGAAPDELARTIFITVDSDTTLVPNAVEEGIKPFTDPVVMSVAGIELGYNAMNNLWTLIQNSLQQVAQAVVSAAWSVTGNMFTNRGPFALYRATLISRVLPLYWGEQFYGHRVVLADDSLLALAGSMYGKSIQQLSAFGLTMWPETLSHHLRQRLRWARGRTIRTFWRVRYYSMSSYIWWFTVANIYSFLIGCAVIVWLVVTWPSSVHIAWRIIGASMLLSWISQLRILAFRRSDETLLDRLLVIAIRPIASLWASIVLTRIVRCVGTVTCLRQGWTTRQDGAELTLNPERREVMI